MRMGWRLHCSQDVHDPSEQADEWSKSVYTNQFGKVIMQQAIVSHDEWQTSQGCTAIWADPVLKGAGWRTWGVKSSLPWEVLLLLKSEYSWVLALERAVPSLLAYQSVCLLKILPYSHHSCQCPWLYGQELHPESWARLLPENSLPPAVQRFQLVELELPDCIDPWMKNWQFSQRICTFYI